MSKNGVLRRTTNECVLPLVGCLLSSLINVSHLIAFPVFVVGGKKSRAEFNNHAAYERRACVSSIPTPVLDALHDQQNCRQLANLH